MNWSQRSFSDSWFNPFQANAPFLYLLKTSENHRFSDVFRGCTEFRDIQIKCVFPKKWQSRNFFWKVEKSKDLELNLLSDSPTKWSHLYNWSATANDLFKCVCPFCGLFWPLWPFLYFPWKNTSPAFPIYPFYIPRCFSGGIEGDQWYEMR